MPLNKFLSASSSAPVTLLYKHEDGTTSVSTSFSFSSIYVGDGFSDRLIIVAVCGGDGSANHTLTDVQIDSVSATIHAAPTAPGGGTSLTNCGIASLVVPTGNSIDIDVTWSSAPDGCAIVVYTLAGYNSATPVDTYSDVSTSGSTTMSATIDLRENGATVFVAGLKSNFDNWSSATSDHYFDDSKKGIAAAHITGSPTTLSHVETVTQNTPSARSIAAVTWR